MMLRNDKRLSDLGLAAQTGYPRILAIYRICYFHVRSSNQTLKNLNQKINYSEINDIQGRNHGKMLAATSAMVDRICPLE
jgi:hypothetical protein